MKKFVELNEKELMVVEGGAVATVVGSSCASFGSLSTGKCKKTSYLFGTSNSMGGANAAGSRDAFALATMDNCVNNNGATGSFTGMAQAGDYEIKRHGGCGRY